MATMNSVIEYVDRVKPNAYTDDAKYRWINTLEGLVSREVLHSNAPGYILPDDADTPLIVVSPYDDIYHLYASAMIDFYNREYNDYNNTILMFKERLDQYKMWYIQNTSYTPSNFKRVMG